MGPRLRVLALVAGAAVSVTDSEVKRNSRAAIGGTAWGLARTVVAALHPRPPVPVDLGGVRAAVAIALGLR
jgi:hypothetical protein